MSIRQNSILFLLLLSFQLLAFGSPAQAVSFNPHYIISDQEFTDYQSMSRESIQKFLEGKSGQLAYYQEKDIDGIMRFSSEIIYNASQKYKINPQVILALLQKEQSLIENPNPSQHNWDWATGFALCDSCNSDNPVLIKYKGFPIQVEKAAGVFRWYLDEYKNNTSDWLFQAGQTYNIDDYQITPLSFATACLYNYTPHYSGNWRFWQLWNKWFAKIYPDGTLLQEKNQPGVWLIQFGKRRPFLSRAAFLSGYDPKKIIQVDRVDLERYEIGSKIKFPNYSLLRSPAGTVYLLVDGERRGIVSQEVFRKIGFNPEEIIDLTWQELDDYPEKEPIAFESIYPTGALLQDKTTGGVWYVKNGIKQPIIDRIILKINFKNQPIIPIDPSELANYPSQSPIKIKDGELITSLPSTLPMAGVEKNSPQTLLIYVISDGEKLPILSPSAFTKLGYKWENVIKVPDKVLQLHLTGLPVGMVR